jgi:hypothetical protein
MTANAVMDSTRALLPSWHRLVAFGFLAGVTLIAMELLLLPAGLSVEELVEIVVYIFPQWTLTGIAIAVIATLAERRLSVAMMVLTLVVFAAAASAVVAGFRALANILGLSLGTSFLAGVAPPWPTFFYNMWVILFFGSLFMAACVLSARSERTRHVLARAEIERGRTETLLSEAQLRALQGHIEPAFLLRVMAEIERRYTTAHTSADRLLDRLVTFLRYAMPGVRGGESTLGDEIALARAYGEVWADLEPARARWCISSTAAVPKVAFPALLLLPVLDCWAAAAPSILLGEIVVTTTDAAVTCALVGPAAKLGDWLPTSLGHRLLVGLRAAYGDSWQLAIRDTMAPDVPALALTLPRRLTDFELGKTGFVGALPHSTNRAGTAEDGAVASSHRFE